MSVLHLRLTNSETWNQKSGNVHVTQIPQVIIPLKVWKCSFIPPTFPTRLLRPTIGSLRTFLRVWKNKNTKPLVFSALPEVHSLEFTGLANSIIVFAD